MLMEHPPVPPPMRKVLVVEDEPDLREVMARVLMEKGYRVRTAEHGLAGLKTIRRFKPDLVFLNYQMPVMDGYSMLETLNKERPAKIPRVIMMSGCTGAQYFERALSLGAIDYLVYPLSLRDLDSIVQEALDPAMDDAKFAARARWRRLLAVIWMIGRGGSVDDLFEEFLGSIRRLPLEELSPRRRQALRNRLLAAAERQLSSTPQPALPLTGEGASAPGFDPTLTFTLLAQAL